MPDTNIKETNPKATAPVNPNPTERTEKETNQAAATAEQGDKPSRKAQMTHSGGMITIKVAADDPASRPVVSKMIGMLVSEGRNDEADAIRQIIEKNDPKIQRQGAQQHEPS